MTFTIFGVAPRSPDWPIGRAPGTSVAAECPRCGKPIAAELKSMRGDFDTKTMADDVHMLAQRSGDIMGCAMGLGMVWPEPMATTVPASLPAAIERAFVQAEANYRMENCEEAAALMYRRALELAIGALHPDLTGALSANIRSLVAKHELPKPIGEWLTHVRLIGNEGAHEADGVKREDLTDARIFADTTLRYLFTLPAQIKARQTANA